MYRVQRGRGRGQCGPSGGRVGRDELAVALRGGERIVAKKEKRCRVGPELAGRVDRVVQQLCGCSRAQARGLVDHGCVAVDGSPVQAAAEPVGPGAEVVVRFEPTTRYRPKPRARGHRGFRLVFEDDHLIVVDKSAALLTVPTQRGETNTLLDAVWRHVSRDKRRALKPAVVHRLDRGTSGLLVFGKSGGIAAALQEQLRLHKPQREYRALVARGIHVDQGTFRSRLSTGANLDRYSLAQQEGGQEAVTHFRVAERLRGATLVDVRLETGRRHQIRVHFAEAGHPVLADPRYRPERARHPAWAARRLALHAALLAFNHPKTGAELRFESPLPDEFERFLRRTRLTAPPRRSTSD